MINLMPVEAALAAGADDGLAYCYGYEIVDGVVIHEHTGKVYNSKHNLNFLFFDARQGNTIAIVPFTDEMHDGLHDAFFDFWGHMMPQVKAFTKAYVDAYYKAGRISVRWLVLGLIVEWASRRWAGGGGR
jgi:hypothetical protein